MNAPKQPDLPPGALPSPRRVLAVMGDLAEGVPLIGPVFGSARQFTREVSAATTVAATRAARLAVAIAVREVIEVLIRDVDLTQLVAENVDVDAIVREVDLDAAVAQVDLDRAVSRLDLDAAVHRVDLIAVANEIIEGVDLAGLIRAATGTVGADVIEDVRSGSERADDAVAAVVDRLLRRRSRRALDGA